MELNAFFQKNPRNRLDVVILLAALHAASLYGSFALERPSLLIIVNMLLTVRLTIDGLHYYELITRDTTRFLVLDEKDQLEIFGTSDDGYAFIKARVPDHAMIRIDRVWHGFKILPLSGFDRNFELHYLGRRYWYGITLRLRHRVMHEELLIRDWNSHADLFRETLKALEGSGEYGLHQLIRRAHAYTVDDRLREQAKSIRRKPAEKNVN